MLKFHLIVALGELLRGKTWGVSKTDLGYYDDLYIGNLELENVMGDVNAGVGTAENHDCLCHFEKKKTR